MIMNHWRLIIEDNCQADYNMAADHYLLEFAEKHPRLPVLRIYGWQTPSITIGFHQKVDEAIDRCRLGFTQLVRRITGGRALYHDSGEITYAVAGNHKHNPGLGQTLHDSYLLIADVLIDFYNKIGWSAAKSIRSELSNTIFDRSFQKGCFASVSRYEIVAFNQKVAASAQRRTKTSFLQHGAVRFSDMSQHPSIIGMTTEIETSPLPSIPINRLGLIDCLVESFAEKLKINFENNAFSETEKRKILRNIERFKISSNTKI